MIKIDNLTRRYGAFAAVDDVSFRIERGEVVGLLGHNGAGKTTIMRMLTGYLEPTSGSIRIDDLTMGGADTAAIQRRIGYLPENCPAWPEMSVLEFLEYQAMLHDVPEAQRPAAIAAAMRRHEPSGRQCPVPLPLAPPRRGAPLPVDCLRGGLCAQAAIFEQRIDIGRAPVEVAEQLLRILRPAARQDGGGKALTAGAG